MSLECSEKKNHTSPQGLGTILEEGRMIVRVRGQRGLEQTSVLGNMIGSLTHELTASVVAHTRLVQDEVSQHSSIEEEEAHEPLP